MRSTESTRFVPARSRSLLGLLTLGLLAGAPAFAQTTPPGAAPAETAPVTAPITVPTTEPVPNLGLPATGADQAAPPLPAEATPPDATPTDPTSTDPSSDSSSTDAAPADAAPTVSNLPEPGSVKVPVLDGEEVLKTVPTVLGEALVYAGEAGDVMARTLAALKADGYAAAGESAAADRVLLSRDGQAFELSGRESFGVTVVSLSRVPGAAPTEASPTDEAGPTEAAPAESSPEEAVPDETAPVEPPTDAPAEPDTDAPTDAAPTEPAVPAPVTPGQP
jgi:hypothetical protein